MALQCYLEELREVHSAISSKTFTDVPGEQEVVKTFMPLLRQWDNFGFFMGVPTSMLNTIQVESGPDRMRAMRKVVHWMFSNLDERKLTWKCYLDLDAVDIMIDVADH